MHADEWKLSYFEFWSLRKFTDKLTYLWHFHDLKLWKMRRKLKPSLGVPFLTPELYVFTRTDLCFKVSITHCSHLVISKGLCFGTRWKVTCEMFIKRFEKITSSVLLDANRSFNWLNTLSLTKELSVEVSMVQCSHLVIFVFLRESCVLRHPFQSRLLGPCLLVTKKLFARRWWDCWSVYLSDKNQ